MYIIFLYNRERLTLFLYLNKHSFNIYIFIYKINKKPKTQKAIEKPHVFFSFFVVFANHYSKN